MQVERRRRLLDRLPIFRDRLGVMALDLEDLSGQLVYAKRGGRLLKHLSHGIVPSAHVQFSGLV